MRVEPINGIKRFFKNTTDDGEGEYAIGLNCRVDREYIGPCFYGKSYLQNNEINTQDNQFWLINDGDGYNVVLFLPLYIYKILLKKCTVK